MNSDNVFESLDNSDDSFIEDVYYTGTNAYGRLKTWFDESEYSPVKFRSNSIRSFEYLDDVSVRFLYSTDVAYEPMDTLLICSASVKTCPIVIDGFEEVENEDGNKHQPFSNLLIYGHNMDYKDEFNSRFDKQFINMISKDYKTKFKKVTLFGCFESIEMLIEIVNFVYDALSDKDIFTKVAIHMDSRVRDDDGNWRTIADVVNSGYIKPGIVENRNIVEFIYKKFDKKIPARLFTSEVKVNKMKNLFDVTEENVNSENSSVEQSEDNMFDDMSDCFGSVPDDEELPF